MSTTNAIAQPQQDPQPHASNLDNPQWYYDNLDAADRLKIREALDMSVPRQIIIDTFFSGLGRLLNSPVLPQHGAFYNASIVPRAFNTTAALNNLESVFGYRYSTDDNPNTPTIDESIPYFRLAIIIPVTNDLRSIGWSSSSRAAFAWQAIGIDVTQKYLTWSVITPRLFSAPIGGGFDYNHGGFDVFEYEPQKSSFYPDLYRSFHSDNLAPRYDNYIWLNDPINDVLLSQGRENLSPAVRQQAILDWQQWFYDTIPKSIIRQVIQPWGVDVDFEGFSPFSVQNYDNWSIGSQTRAVVTVPADFIDLNPALVSSVFDTYVHAGGQPAGLLYRHVPDGTGAHTAWQVDGYLASDWIVSANQTVWELRIRDGVKWHDGTTVTADDVLYTVQLHLHAASSSTLTSSFTDLLDNTSVSKINSSTIRFNFLKFDPHINSFLTFPIMQQTQLEPIGFANLNSHGTNDGSIPIIGYGPYRLDVLNSTGAFLTLNTNNSNGQAWANSPLCSLPGRKCSPALTDIVIQKLISSTAALTGLQNGEIDIIDSQTGLAALNSQLESDPNTKSILYLEYGYEEFGYNQMSPIWGINPIDPNEMYPIIPETLHHPPQTIITVTVDGPLETTTTTIADFFGSPGSQNPLTGLVITFLQYSTGVIAGISGGVLLGAMAIFISRRRGS